MGQIRGLAAAVWSSGPLRVLAVDDNRDTVQTLGILFRSEGMDVRILQASEDVIRVAEEFFPDVVLLDIGMPGRNGFEVAEDLRRRFGRTRPVIVAVTGYSGIADKCRARACGFDHYCVKPYDPVALLQLVSKIGGDLANPGDTRAAWRPPRTR